MSAYLGGSNVAAGFAFLWFARPAFLCAACSGRNLRCLIDSPPPPPPPLLNPPGQPKGTGSGSPDSPPAFVQSNSRVDRQLCVVVDGQQLRARFELVMPAREGLVKELWRSAGRWLRLVRALLARFGWLTQGVAAISGYTTTRLRITTAGLRQGRYGSDPDGERYLLRRHPHGVAPCGSAFRTVTSGVREITVDTRDVEMESGQANAELTQTGTSADAGKNTATETGCWTSLGTGMTRHVYLLNASGKGDNGNDPLTASFVLNRDHVVSLRTADVAADTVPAIDSLLQVGVNAFPYGLAAWYLWRTRLRRPDFRNCVLCVFWLVAATGALWTARHLLFDGDVFGWVAGKVSRWVTVGTSTGKSPSVLVIDTMVLIGSLAWPLIAATLGLPAPTRSANSWRWRARALIPYLATMVAAVVAAAVLNEWSQASLASAETFSLLRCSPPSSHGP